MSSKSVQSGWKRGLKWSLGLLLALLICAELGLRWSAHTESRRAAHPSIDMADRLLLFLGDSVAGGLGVGADAAFPQRVVDHLNGEGIGDFQMMNRARPGWDVERLVDDALPVIEALPDGAKPLVFVMIGHNDINMWNGWKPHSWTEVHGTSDDEAPVLRRKSGLYVTRVFRWFMAGLEAPAVVADPYFEARFSGWMARLQAASATKGGEVYLLTYPIVGRAPADMDAKKAAVLEVTRELQLLCNVAIRNVAAERGLPVIDIEAEVQSPPVWDPAWFRDHSHPTASHHALIATAIVGAL